MSARETADGLLLEIDQKLACLSVVHEEAEADLEVVLRRYADRIGRLQAELEVAEVELERLVKSARKEILGDGDRADLAHGAVLLKVERRVKRVRKMLATLKAQGESALIKVEEAPDWDKIEKLDDGDLAKIGTKRVPKTVFSYEIKGGR